MSMGYRTLWTRMWYHFVGFGVCAEMLLLTALRDLMRHGDRGATRILDSGMAQLAALPGEVGK